MWNYAGRSVSKGGINMSRVNEKDIEYPYYKCELTDEEAMHVGVNLHKLMVFIGENLEPKKEDPTQNAIYWIRKRLNHDYRRVSKRQLYNLMRMLTKDNRKIKYVKIPYISDKLFKAIFVMYEQALKSAKIPPENIKILSDMKKTRGRLFYCEQTNAFERSLPNYYYTTDKQLRLIQALHDDLSATGSTLGEMFHV